MYFDPGTGSMLIQVLLGAIPVVGAFFVGLTNKKSRDEDENEKRNSIKKDDGFEVIDEDD